MEIVRKIRCKGFRSSELSLSIKSKNRFYGRFFLAHPVLLEANQSEQGKIHGLEKAILELLSNFRSIHDLILVKCRP